MVEQRVRVGVTDDDPGRGRRPPPRRCGAGRGPTGDSTPWVVMARPVRRAARAAARWTRSSRRRHPGLVRADLADDPGPDPAVADPLGGLRDELVGQVVHRSPVDRGLGRVVGAAIPAAAHDDVELARLGRCRRARPGRARPRAASGRPGCDPPDARIRRQLLEDHRLVARELPVVPAVGDVPERDLRVLVREREAERPRGRSVRGPSGRGPWPAMLRRRGRSLLDPGGREQHVQHGARAAPRLRRPVAIPGLDPLEQEPVEQRQEAAGEAVDVEPGGELARGSRPRGAASSPPRPAARGGGRASRGPRARRAPRPMPGRGRPGPARPRTRRWSRRSRRPRPSACRPSWSAAASRIGQFLEPLPGDQVAALEEERVLAREVGVDGPDRQTGSLDHVGDRRALEALLARIPRRRR